MLVTYQRNIYQILVKTYFFQKKDPVQRTSKVRMALALAQINRGTLIQGLTSISSSSKSVAKLLQPQLACRLLELRHMSHRLLREMNAPNQPLYSTQASGCCIRMSCGVLTISECWVLSPKWGIYITISRLKEHHGRGGGRGPEHGKK